MMLAGLQAKEKGNKSRIQLQQIYRLLKGDSVEMNKTFEDKEQRRRKLIKVMEQIQDRGWNICFASSLFLNGDEKNTGNICRSKRIKVKK